jgi:superfamily II DNA/RNA helicase
MRATMEQIEKGCDILVVTSGRLKHHIIDHVCSLQPILINFDYSFSD